MFSSRASCKRFISTFVSAGSGFFMNLAPPFYRSPASSFSQYLATPRLVPDRKISVSHFYSLSLRRMSRATRLLTCSPVFRSARYVRLEARMMMDNDRSNGQTGQCSAKDAC
jgi:hypothetical protein